MTEQLIALADCNSFYVACQQAFDPSIRNKPVVVLSNSDGCVVARSQEVKALGVKMGQPWHELKSLSRKHGILAYSSNYALYADMSNRVMRIIGDMVPVQEVYSIDETFCLLSGIENPLALASQMRDRVLRWTGLPICVGLSTSRTRAKLSNKIAKQNRAMNGVFHLDALTRTEQSRLLQGMDVSEVWGVGRRLTPRLQKLGIRTVADLRDAPPKAIRAHFGVVLERTVDELNGRPCTELEVQPPTKQQIMTSRSFGRDVESWAEVRAAVLSHTASGAAKLREQGSLAGGMQVFIQTNPFKPSAPQYARGLTVPILPATDDTMMLTRIAAAGLARIFRPGFAYKKAGVMMLNLTPRDQRQGTLFDDVELIGKRHRLNSTLDRINLRYGQGALGSAAIRIGTDWHMTRSKLSPLYTTDWTQLPVAIAR